MAGTGVATASSSAAALSVGRRPPVTIEERIAELEVQMKEVRAEFKQQVVDLAAQLDAAKNDLAARIQGTDGKIESLAQRVEKAAVGGFKLQAFGVLLAVYGAVTSVLA